MTKFFRTRLQTRAREIRNLGSLYTLLEGISQKTPEKRKQSTKNLIEERNPEAT